MRRLESVCRTSGLKVTHQRVEIFSELARAEDHPDAERVYQRVHKRVPAISRDTVYRTLALLEERGLISKAEVSGPARYDANTKQHHHLVCVRCGVVRDFFSKTMDALSVPAEVGDWGTVENIRVQVRGVCRKCTAQDKAAHD